MAVIIFSEVMIYNFGIKWAYKFYSVASISQSTMNLNKCYFRYIQNQSEEKIDISFLFKVKDSVRQFNLSRNPTENLDALITRISANIQKAVNKSSKKKGNAEQLEIDVKFLKSNNYPLVADKTTCKDLFAFKEPLKVKIFDQVYEAIFNVPWVVSISLPQCILAGFPVYPENLLAYFIDNDKCIFKWYCGNAINDTGKEINQIKWEFVGTGRSYTPTVQDIGKKLRLECIPGNKNTVGPAVDVISKKVIEAGPGKCPFETRQLFTSTKLSGKSFRCVSYNILADLYCDSDFTRTELHPYCPPYALHIDYRKQLIIKELSGYNADIVCLQEVDKKVFQNTLEPFLNMEGLDGLFYKKGKEVAEGLACFYRKDRFRLLESKLIVLSQIITTEPWLQSLWDAVKKNNQLRERLLDRSTVSSATILQSLENPNEILLVGNTHLYFHPDSDHIRLLQGGVVIYWLRNLKNNLIEQNPDKRVSLIICGDFNSVPSCGIYQLYTSGVAPSNLTDWKSNMNEVVEDLTLKQDIPLASACGTPTFTNYTAGFADCLDYIYYEKTSLKVEQVIPFPSVEELQIHTALPSIVFPSDHIALISDLRFS